MSTNDPARGGVGAALLVGAGLVPLTALALFLPGILLVALDARGWLPASTAFLLEDSDPRGLLVWSLLGDALLVAALVLLARWSREPPATCFRLGWGRGRLWHPPLWVLGGWSAHFVGVPLVELLFDGPGTYGDELADAFRTREPLMLVGVALSVGLLAPLLEELVFRGYVQGRLERRWPAWLAIACSALLFSAMHVAPQHALAVLPAGLWFGYLATLNGSVWPAIVCHAVDNGLFLLAALAAEAEGPVDAGAAERPLGEPTLGELLAPALLLLLVAWILRRTVRRRRLVTLRQPGS